MINLKAIYLPSHCEASGPECVKLSHGYQLGDNFLFQLGISLHNRFELSGPFAHFSLLNLLKYCDTQQLLGWSKDLAEDVQATD